MLYVNANICLLLCFTYFHNMQLHTVALKLFSLTFHKIYEILWKRHNNVPNIKISQKMVEPDKENLP